MIEKFGNILFIGVIYVSFFLLWNLFIRFPDEITAKLVFLILCPYIICTLVYIIFTKDKKILEYNSWRRMQREGKVV